MIGGTGVDLEDLTVVGQRNVSQLLQERWVSSFANDELDLLYQNRYETCAQGKLVTGHTRLKVVSKLIVKISNRKVTIGGPHPRAEDDQGNNNSTGSIQPPAVTTDQRSKQTKSIDNQVVAMVARKDVGRVVLSNSPAVQEQAQLASYC